MVTSSVKYEELKELREKFPSEFIDNYTWLVPIDLLEQITVAELIAKQIEQSEYPVQRYDDPRDCSCGGNCACGLATKTVENKNQIYNGKI